MDASEVPIRKRSLHECRDLAFTYCPGRVEARKLPWQESEADYLRAAVLSCALVRCAFTVVRGEGGLPWSGAVTYQVFARKRLEPLAVKTRVVPGVDDARGQVFQSLHGADIVGDVAVGQFIQQRSVVDGVARE